MKTVKLEDNVWRQIMSIKLNENYATVSDVIDKLLVEYKKRKGSKK